MRQNDKTGLVRLPVRKKKIVINMQRYPHGSRLIFTTKKGSVSFYRRSPTIKEDEMLEKILSNAVECANYRNFDELLEAVEPEIDTSNPQELKELERKYKLICRDRKKLAKIGISDLRLLNMYYRVAHIDHRRRH